MMQTERIIKHALLDSVPIVVVINKLDRLILELKLPPQDAYYKLRHTLQELNNIVATVNPDHPPLSPESGNVCFAIGSFGCSFTISSFAQIYAESYGKL